MTVNQTPGIIGGNTHKMLSTFSHWEACSLSHLSNSWLWFSLEIEGSGKTWRQDQRIRLHHVDTSGYLHSHNKKYTGIPGGHQEVRNNWFLRTIIARLNFKLLVMMASSMRLLIHPSQVCGVRDKRADNVWLAAEGVYFPAAETKWSMYIQHTVLRWSP